MPNFYATYGCEGQPYVGGWTKIEAPDFNMACEAFRLFHPDVHEGLLNCCSVYTEAQFMKTCMGINGTNIGVGCQETIILRRVADN